MDCGVCSKLGIRCSRKWVMGMEDMVMCLDMGKRYLNKVCNGNVRMCMSKTCGVKEYGQFIKCT